MEYSPRAREARLHAKRTGIWRIFIDRKLKYHINFGINVSKFWASIINRNHSKQFFLHLNYFAPHTPLELPPGYIWSRWDLRNFILIKTLWYSSQVITAPPFTSVATHLSILTLVAGTAPWTFLLWGKSGCCWLKVESVCQCMLVQVHFLVEKITTTGATANPLAGLIHHSQLDGVTGSILFLTIFTSLATACLSHHPSPSTGASGHKLLLLSAKENGNYCSD